LAKTKKRSSKMAKQVDEFKARQEEAAAAVFAFGEKWDRLLQKAAENIHCSCATPRPAAAGEFQHEPGCGVGKMLQFARLIGEDAENVRAKAFGPRTRLAGDVTADDVRRLADGKESLFRRSGGSHA
jgi:hypothetical protein